MRLTIPGCGDGELLRQCITSLTPRNSRPGTKDLYFLTPGDSDAGSPQTLRNSGLWVMGESSISWSSQSYAVTKSCESSMLRVFKEPSGGAPTEMKLEKSVQWYHSWCLIPVLWINEYLNLELTWGGWNPEALWPWANSFTSLSPSRVTLGQCILKASFIQLVSVVAWHNLFSTENP